MKFWISSTYGFRRIAEVDASPTHLITCAKILSVPFDIYLNKYFISILHPQYSTLICASNAKHNDLLYGTTYVLSSLTPCYVTETLDSLLL